MRSIDGFNEGNNDPAKTVSPARQGSRMVVLAVALCALVALVLGVVALGVWPR